MVPSMMYQLLNHPEFSKVDLDNLPSVSPGTGRMHNDRRERFEHRVNHVPFLTDFGELPDRCLPCASNVNQLCL
jgi:hypothetical protein